MSADKKAKTPSKKKPNKTDMLLVGPKTEDGGGVHVIRQTNDTLSAGELRPLQHGKPATGELVSLKPRDESPALFDVDVLHTPKTKAIGKPARVATKRYRHGWNRIWDAPSQNKKLN